MSLSTPMLIVTFESLCIILLIISASLKSITQFTFPFELSCINILLSKSSSPKVISLFPEVCSAGIVFSPYAFPSIVISPVCFDT